MAIAPIKYDDTPPNMDHFTGYKENSNATTKIAPEKSEGEKLRQRACMLCQDPKFAEFLDNTHYSLAELNSQASKECLYEYCGILSRKELVLNVNAQIRFKDLDRQYKEWLNPIDEQYEDNLSRG